MYDIQYMYDNMKWKILDAIFNVVLLTRQIKMESSQVGFPIIYLKSKNSLPGYKH